MIYTWLANGLIRLVVIILAVLGLIMTPVAVVQTVRLDGISLFGWHLIDGAIHTAETAKRDLGTCRTNTTILKSGIDKQNASIAGLHQELLDTQARADAALAKAKAGRVAADANLAAILGAKAGPDICKSADALILEQAQ